MPGHKLVFMAEQMWITRMQSAQMIPEQETKTKDPGSIWKNHHFQCKEKPAFCVRAPTMLGGTLVAGELFEVVEV